MRDLGYDFIRFFAMSLILIYHFFTTLMPMGIKFPAIIYYLNTTSYINLGSIGVALFFILSGSLLTLHGGDTYKGTRGFYKKRIMRICIPQWLGFIGLFILMYVVDRNIIYTDKIGMFISFLGINYCNLPWGYFGINTPWIIGEWFTAVIIAIYLMNCNF